MFRKNLRKGKSYFELRNFRKGRSHGRKSGKLDLEKNHILN